MQHFDFNPDQVAHYEVEGWKAYYDHAWFKLLNLVVNLVQAQFHIPFPVSLLAAYHVTRASAAWVPKDHDLEVVRAYNEKFYRLARQYSGLTFDPVRVAALETKYWDVHRRLVGNADKTEFIDAMIDLHSAIFGISRELAHESAEQRVLANNVLDTITGRTSPDPAGDWLRCEEHLRLCYRSIQRALNAQVA